MSEQAIALNRFGLGARPDEAPPARPQSWLLDQFGHYDPAPPAWRAQPTTRALRATGERIRQQQGEAADTQGKEAQRIAFRKFARATYADAVDARVAAALASGTPFVERLVHFWANHFAVSGDRITITSLVGCFEAEAIRPHVLGRFEDMLFAVERHPAMLMFLDQTQSAGPNSAAALRKAARHPDNPAGLNENLAREIIELHTLGVRTGYTQADVTEFARALTGWGLGSLPKPGRDTTGPGADPAAFVFHADQHEPGTRTIRGKSYAQPADAQAAAVLRDLCADPATAHHISTKLARHFVADEPPPALVERMARAYLAGNGDLPAVYRVLVEAPEAWATPATKFKTPWDWMVSSLRATGPREARQHMAQFADQLGQSVWKPRSPAGWDDIAATWAAPDALIKRVEFAQRFATELADTIDARTLGPRILLGALSPATLSAIGRADTGPAALALLLVSPDFQRR